MRLPPGAPLPTDDSWHDQHEDREAEADRLERHMIRSKAIDVLADPDADHHLQASARAAIHELNRRAEADRCPTCGR